MDIKDYEPLWGAWRSDRLIGEGAYGNVYRVKKEEFGKSYFSAVKAIEIPHGDADLTAMRREGMNDAAMRAFLRAFVADIIREIDLMDMFKGHSNVVSIEDHMVIEEAVQLKWIILIRMELLTSLADWVLNKKPSEALVAKLGIDLCQALELCESRSIIHRDIKPDNIFISPFGDFKLGDFGIARQMENNAGALSKRGTFLYMAPEIYCGKNYNATVDTYALGIVMYRLLNNNRLPFMPDKATVVPNDRDEAMMTRLRGAPIPPINGVSPRMNQIVLKAVSYEWQERYLSAAEMKRALQSFLGLEAEPVAGGEAPASANSLAQKSKLLFPELVSTTEFDPMAVGEAERRTELSTIPAIFEPAGEPPKDSEHTSGKSSQLRSISPEDLLNDRQEDTLLAINSRTLSEDNAQNAQSQAGEHLREKTGAHPSKTQAQAGEHADVPHNANLIYDATMTQNESTVHNESLVQTQAGREQPLKSQTQAAKEQPLKPQTQAAKEQPLMPQTQAAKEQPPKLQTQSSKEQASARERPKGKKAAAKAQRRKKAKKPRQLESKRTVGRFPEAEKKVEEALNYIVPKAESLAELIAAKFSEALIFLMRKAEAFIKLAKDKYAMAQKSLQEVKLPNPLLTRKQGMFLAILAIGMLTSAIVPILIINAKESMQQELLGAEALPIQTMPPKPTPTPTPKPRSLNLHELGIDREHATIVRLPNESFTSIEQLSELTLIRLLDLNGNNIENLGPLAQLSQLKYLDLTGNPVTSAEPLKDLFSLEKLMLGDCGLTDISSLVRLANLKELDLHGNSIDRIELLASLRKLEYLNIADNPLSQSQIDWLMSALPTCFVDIAAAKDNSTPMSMDLIRSWNGVDYMVKSGDTLESISEKFYLDSRMAPRILIATGHPVGYELAPGDIIFIPYEAKSINELTVKSANERSLFELKPPKITENSRLSFFSDSSSPAFSFLSCTGIEVAISAKDLKTAEGEPIEKYEEHSWDVYAYCQPSARFNERFAKKSWRKIGTIQLKKENFTNNSKFEFRAMNVFDVKILPAQDNIDSWSSSVELVSVAYD
ncbi:MAG: protein kinase [Clostridiales bacterium]|jgi:serine/threonine protein kinase/LysM repeat protein|nr:protein kinase [Clostridiales bacterium]